MYIMIVIVMMDAVAIRRRNNMKLFDELKWRGLIKDITSPELEEMLEK